MPTIRRIAAILSALVCLTFLSSRAAIRWIEKDHDFGLMHETAGPATASSRFINDGPDSISIFSVRPSCGCTSADFSDESIAPGDTAVISYTYDPYMRPGRFDKTVKVRLSDGSRHSIRITGNVLGTPASLESLYPVDAGNMRLSQGAIHAGEVKIGASPVFFINAYSLPLDSIAPALSAKSPAIATQASAKLAGPGDVLTFSVYFDPRKAGAYGPVEIPMQFSANHGDSTILIPFRAFIIPDAARLAAALKGKAPRADIAPVTPATLSSDGRAEAYISIANNGNAPLHILNISSPSPVLEPVKPPKEIKPGKSARIKLRIDRATLPDAPSRINLDIVTDDPDQTHIQTSIYLPPPR